MFTLADGLADFLVSGRARGLSPKTLDNGGDLFSLQKILGHTTLDMVRRYVNLDTDEVKRQHAQASPVDRLAIGPRVSVLLPWPVADRLEELACRQRTSVEELVKQGVRELIERGRDCALEQSPRRLCR